MGGRLTPAMSILRYSSSSASARRSCRPGCRNHDHRPPGHRRDPRPPRAVRAREPHPAPLQPARWRGRSSLPGVGAIRSLRHVRAQGRGRDDRGAGGPAHDAVLAAALWRSRRHGRRHRGPRRLAVRDHAVDRHHRLAASADGGPTAASVAAKVIANRTAGGIVLMHLGGYPTRNALPAMLTGLRAAGYSATSLSALYR